MPIPTTASALRAQKRKRAPFDSVRVLTRSLLSSAGTAARDKAGGDERGPAHPRRVRCPFGTVGTVQLMDAARSESTLRGATEAVGAIVERLAAEGWQLAEVSFHERGSAQAHLQALDAAGFTTVSVGSAGVPTAFVAEWTGVEGGPTIGFLPEYDALPALGNDAVPRRQPRADGVTSG